MNEEIFEPKPDEWFACTLTHVNLERRTFTVTLSNGERVWAHERDCKTSPGAHLFCLKTDGSVEASVRIARQKHRLYPYHALEVRLDYSNYEPKRERGIMMDWSGNRGVIRRPCGCFIFAPPNGDDARQFFANDEVEFNITYSGFKQTFVAQSLKLAKRNEVDYE